MRNESFSYMHHSIEIFQTTPSENEHGNTSIQSNPKEHCTDFTMQTGHLRIDMKNKIK